jgi:hypothetical protein
MLRGIYTLANDAVYDQLVALLNSIEANYSKDIPVCVIPYDENIGRISEEIKSRPNVTLFQDRAAIAKWEQFAQDAWNLSPRTYNLKPNTSDLEPAKWGRHKFSVHRKFCCFDGPFEKFIFLDADTLVMKPLDFIFEQLDRSEFVVHDYQHKDASHVFNVKSPRLYQVFSKDRINAGIFCTGFFASKRGLFDDARCRLALSGLKNGEAEILYPKCAEQSLLNYMVMKSNVNIYNFALSLPREERTGDSVTSTHFEDRKHILYDKGNRLTYLHYIGITSDPFRRLCGGKNIDFPYRDIFLHYRYLNESGRKPRLKGRKIPYNAKPGIFRRVFKRIKRILLRLINARGD